MATTRTASRTAARPTSKAAPAARRAKAVAATVKAQADHRHSWKVKSKVETGRSPNGNSVYYRRDATCTLCGVHEKDQAWSQRAPAAERNAQPTRGRRTTAARPASRAGARSADRQQPARRQRAAKAAA